MAKNWSSCHMEPVEMRQELIFKWVLLGQLAGATGLNRINLVTFLYTIILLKET